MERQVTQLKFTLSNMGLNEYQASTLAHLIYLGETKATNLSKASGVPNARIYGVLDELSQKGLLIVRPGRPALYSPLTPAETADALVSASRQEIRQQLTVIEDYRDGFEEVASSIFMKAGTGEVRTGLIRIVSVGNVSMDETRKMYRSAEKTLIISTRAMEYIDKVREDLEEAVGKGVDIKVLMRKPDSLSSDDASKQGMNLAALKEVLGGDAQIKYSPEVEIRGCVVDHEVGGKALFLVEEEGVPFFLREAAVTSHPGVVKALGSMLILKWKFDSE
ncbi:MAG: TrmB family transcriptional regulator [Candidatus Bathyarchaeota archaeon]